MATEDDRPVTVAEAARILGVTTKTIYRWRGKGLLERVPVTGRAQLVTSSSVRRLQRRGTA